MANRVQKVSLEKIVQEKITKQIIKSIDSDDLDVWESVEPGLSLEIGRKTIKLRLNCMTSTKKFLAWTGGIVTTLGGVITVIKWLMPILIAYFAQPPP